MSDKTDILKLAGTIVSAYVRRNEVPRDELPALIKTVHDTLASIREESLATPGATDREPAVPVEESVTDDYIICLEDGERFKSLRRHLRTRYDMTPEQYRSRWGLPADYPMVAPNYAQARSNLAKQMGLGKKSTADD